MWFVAALLLLSQYPAGSLANIDWQAGDWALACDFTGNDIDSKQTSGENCGGTCASRSGCTHFTWTNFNGGTCWLKGGTVSKNDAIFTGDYSMVCGIVGEGPGPEPGDGSINVDGVGTIHLITRGNVQVQGNGFSIIGGGRVYFANQPGGLGDPNIFWQTELLGKRFSYEVDVSNVGCHCNAAAYFAQLPGYDSNQQLQPGPDGDYYCDANMVNNNFCPEYDVFEGNKHTMVSTLHTCDYVAPHYYPNCDRGGCGSNAYNVNPNIMCPEDRCTINTNKPFTISHSQSVAGDGTMNNVNVWFSQEGRTADFNVCQGDYVKWMGYSLNGIVFVASLWGGPDIDMGWLDGMTGCSGQCNLAGASVTFRNFALTPI